MPKKPNRTDMQEYVPSGNGDASGEYADESGSNTHFTNFKKPDDPLAGENIGKKEPNIKVELTEEQELEKAHKSFEDFIDTKYCDEKIKPYAKKYINICPVENKTMLDNLIQQKGVSIQSTSGTSCCSGLGADLQLNESDLKTAMRTEGETFFHELGHGLDEAYKLSGEENNPNWNNKMSWRAMLVASASNRFITSNGKTLNDTLLRMQPPARERYKKASIDFKAEQQKFYNEHFPDYYSDLEKQKELKEKIDTIRYAFNEDKRYISFNEYEQAAYESYRRKEITYEQCHELIETARKGRNAIADEYFEKADKMPENKEWHDLVQKQWDIEREFDKQVRKHWGDVSDMFSMQKVGNFGFSHGSSYASQSGYRGKEFFAECFSAESCDPQAVELIKKYFPDGWQAYKETKNEIIRLQKKGGK